MLLSSGVVWRHRSLEDFRAECPGGDSALQRRIVEELDDALDWLESLGVEPVARRDRQPAHRRAGGTTPRALTDVLVRAAGDVRLEEPFREAQILATGGFGARLARERGLLLRANPWSEGDGLDYGVARGASLTAGLDEFYGRALPGEVDERELRVRRAALRAPRARARRRGPRPRRGRLARERSRPAAARRPGLVRRRRARAAQPVRERTVADLVDAARAAGGDVRPAEELPFALPASPKLVEPPFVAVRVHAAVTHTIGGLRIDERARVLDATAGPSPGLLRGGRRRRRHLHRRLRQRPRRRARLRPHRRRDRARLTGQRVRRSCGVSAQRRRSPGSGEGPSLLTRSIVSPASTVCADRGRLAFALLQRPAGRRPDEEDVARRCPGCRSRPPSAADSSGYGSPAYAGRTTWIDGAAVRSLLDREAAVEGRGPLADRVQRGRAPLAGAVVGHDRLDLALPRCRGSRPRSSTAARAAPPGSATRGRSGRARPAPSRRGSPPAPTSTSICTLCSSPELVRELVHGRAEALVAQHDRLDVEGEVAERADRLAVALERGRHDPARRLRPAVVDRLHRRVEHQRDPGEVLHRPVVEEEREAAPLVLLGGDDPLDEPLALVVGDVARHINR